ncbi:MAG: hypothetical protein ACTMIL_04395 [Brevibacterium aurantiacum]
MPYLDPLQQLGDQRKPEANDHDTALLVSDDLGGHFAVITRGSIHTMKGSSPYR